jgi:MYXO-CTERM domain-containing protein
MRALIPFCGVMMICSSVAWANPMATEGLRARQAYDTQHVQLSFFTVATTGPTKVERDGKELTVTWVKKSISLNTGSGVTSVEAYQICDCSPGLGQHSYTVYGGGAQPTQLDSKVTVVASYPTPGKLDAGVPATDLSPWDEPDPVEMQGLDCVSACTAKQDAGVAKDSGVVKGDTDDSGCSVGLGGGGLLALLALGLIGALRRRA